MESQTPQNEFQSERDAHLASLIASAACFQHIFKRLESDAEANTEKFSPEELKTSIACFQLLDDLLTNIAIQIRLLESEEV